jgi:hypothetical protein
VTVLVDRSAVHDAAICHLCIYQFKWPFWTTLTSYRVKTPLLAQSEFSHGTGILHDYYRDAA